MRRLPVAVAAVLACGLAQAAGQVEVNFVAPERFADIGRSPVDIDRNTQVLRAQLVALARKLPDGQALRVDVLDVDLAGELYPFRRVDEVRVLRGTADWPSMKLRYTLSAAGRTLASGEEAIADMDYLHGRTQRLQDQALDYDRRLLARWFDERIVGASRREP